MKILSIVCVMTCLLGACNIRHKQVDKELLETTEQVDALSEEEWAQFRYVDGLVGAKEFKRLINECDSALILDARPVDVFRTEPRIKGAEGTINNHYLKAITENLHRDHPIFVYCGQEIRSPYVVKYLVRKGFNNIYELEGGLISWKKMKLPLVDPS